jgi:hypothetical protein
MSLVASLTAIVLPTLSQFNIILFLFLPTSRDVVAVFYIIFRHSGCRLSFVVGYCF